MPTHRYSCFAVSGQMMTGPSAYSRSVRELFRSKIISISTEALYEPNRLQLIYKINISDEKCKENVDLYTHSQ
jgi:hypothetical protein